MFRKILHANDGSEPAFAALAMAIELAKRDQAELHLVAVEEMPAVPEFIEEIRETRALAARRYHATLQRARAAAEASGVVLHPHVLAGHPVGVVIEIARELGADLLVIGATGHSALYERMIGSRADRIVQMAPCPVLVVR